MGRDLRSAISDRRRPGHQRWPGRRRSEWPSSLSADSCVPCRALHLHRGRRLRRFRLGWTGGVGCAAVGLATGLDRGVHRAPHSSRGEANFIRWATVPTGHAGDAWALRSFQTRFAAMPARCRVLWLSDTGSGCGGRPLPRLHCRHRRTLAAVAEQTPRCVRDCWVGHQTASTTWPRPGHENPREAARRRCAGLRF